MAVKATRWLKLFEQFLPYIRVRSREVVAADPRGSPLEMWESQRRFVQEVGQGLDNDIHVFRCLKSRQQGITTVSLAVDFFWLAMHPALIGCLVTDSEKNREAARGNLIHYVNNMPEGYFGNSFSIVRSNRTMLQFSNGSRLDFLVAGTKNKGTAWGEGIGYAFAHCTEVANYGNVEGLKSLEEGFSTNNPHALYMYESTAKGFNHWRTSWMAGQADRYTQRSFFVGWWAGDHNIIRKSDPRFLQYGRAPASGEEREKARQVEDQYGHKVSQEQLAWIRWKQSNAGAEKDLLEQNQPWTAEEAFVLTGYSFFQPRIITQDLKKIYDGVVLNTSMGYRYEVDGGFFSFRMFALDPRVDPVEDIELKVWEEPVADGRYVIGMDPAYGRKEWKDSHVISVWRCFADRMVQVAEYATADVEVKHAAWVLFHLSAAYRNCVVNVEITGPGRHVMDEFDHLRQLVGAEMNKIMTEARGWEDAAASARWYLYHRPDSFGAGYQANFESNWRTKQDMLHGLRGSYMSGEIEIRSIKLLKEMENVVVDDDDIGAPESRGADSKDDRVFAMGLANKAWRDWVRKDMIAQGLTFEVVMSDAVADKSPVVKSMNSLVRGFLLTQAQKADEARAAGPQPPLWKSEHGLA
jgi:hypothetical protein